VETKTTLKNIAYKNNLFKYKEIILIKENIDEGNILMDYYTVAV